MNGATEVVNVVQLTEMQIALIPAIAALAGSIIGVLGSWLSIWIQRSVSKSGKASIYVKFVFSKSALHKPCGCYKDGDGYPVLHIPLWADICNTSDYPKIIRDLNIAGYANGKEVVSFTQIQAVTGENKEYIPLGNNGAYTFVIPPNSASRFNLEFSLKQSEVDETNKDFDQLILSYANEKNKFFRFLLTDIDDIWKSGEWRHKKQWLAMDCEVK